MSERMYEEQVATKFQQELKEFILTFFEKYEELIPESEQFFIATFGMTAMLLSMYDQSGQLDNPKQALRDTFNKIIDLIPFESANVSEDDQDNL